MSLKRAAPRSVKIKVLAAMLPCMVALAGVDVWLTRQDALVAHAPGADPQAIHHVVRKAVARNTLTLVVTLLALSLMLSRLLRPIARLVAQVETQSADDMHPLEAAGLSAEIQQLVDAVNQQRARARHLIDQQRSFLDDAAHQLRTPLSTLQTQVGYARRLGPTGELAQVLSSMQTQLEHATRSANQLLALARADAAALTKDTFDLGDLTREIARWLLPLVASKTLDFAVDVPEGPCLCTGDRQLLGEAMSNLMHNAIHYAEEGGRVTVTAHAGTGGFAFSAFNSGQPIPDSVIRSAGKRFVKGSQGSQGAHKGGAGLGLAIAKSVIERHGGELTLGRDAQAHVNAVRLRWPAGIGNAAQA